jgi:hypothetical protein
MAARSRLKDEADISQMAGNQMSEASPDLAKTVGSNLVSEVPKAASARD